MPWCLGTSGSVRASRTAKSARSAHVVQIFWPVITQSSPSRSARVDSEARSLPDPGSLNSWHQISSARVIGGRKRRRCASEPNANSAGAARPSPSGFSRGRWYRLVSCSTARTVSRDHARPPYARSQPGVTRPERPKTGYHARYSSGLRTALTAAGPPRSPASRQACGSRAASQSRTAATATSGEVCGPA